MGVMQRPRGALRTGHAVTRAVGPGVGARSPRRPVPDNAVFLVGLDIGIAHAFEVIVGRIELAHVVETKEVILSLPSPPLGCAMEPRQLAAAPLADRPVLAHRLLLDRPHADAIEVFRVEVHCLYVWAYAGVRTSRRAKPALVLLAWSKSSDSGTIT